MTSESYESDECVYEIRVERHLGPAVWAHFPALDVRLEANGTTLLSGPLPDQAALHGVLARIRDLGLKLVEVRRIEQLKDDV